MKTVISFQEHMKDRASMMDNVVKATIGYDFAVFEFEDKEDLQKGIGFCEVCNRSYHYTFDSNLTDKFVCFNSK